MGIDSDYCLQMIDKKASDLIDEALLEIVNRKHQDPLDGLTLIDWMPLDRVLAMSLLKSTKYNND